jgi:cytosine/adenosine deaminase-related metal-dependent hydrolase
MNKILIRNCRYLITRPGSVEWIIQDGAIYIEDSQILAVGKSPEIEAQFAGQPGLDILDAHEKAVLPGLVDAHNHVGEVHTLLVPGWLDTPITGIVDAMDRMYWPAYNWLTEQSAYDLTLFGLLHVLKHGATTHSDAMIYPDAIYRASVEAKARTVIYPQMISSVQLADARDEDEYLAHTEAAIQNYHNTGDGMISVGVHPSAIYNNTEEMLLGCMELAGKYGVQFVTHLAESPEEMAKYAEIYREYGGVVQYLRTLGLLGSQTVLFHGTLLDEGDIDILVETGTSLVHCPSTNAWFGYCAYLPYMLHVGMHVGLGTDCVTHNLFNVIFSVMQHHNIMPRDLRGVDPAVIFELATLGGARVLGMEESIGSLEPGKRADIITIDLHENSSLFPLNPQIFYSMLALNGAGSEACDVLIDGVFVRRDSRFTFLDEAAIIAHAREWCDRFALDYHRMKQAKLPMFRRLHEEFQFPQGRFK